MSVTSDDKGTITAYPLAWPMGWVRTKFRSRSEFGAHSLANASQEVLRQLRLLGASRVVISTNIELRQDGLPYSGRKAPNDPGAAIYFSLKGKPLVLACDKWHSVEDNVWAIAKHIDALRGQNRWGVGSVEQAFAGYTALPQPKAKGNWWEVLGVARSSNLDQINAAFRSLAKQHHPDAGGDADRFIEIKEALEEARKEKIKEAASNV